MWLRDGGGGGGPGFRESLPAAACPGTASLRTPPRRLTNLRAVVPPEETPSRKTGLSVRFWAVRKSVITSNACRGGAAARGQRGQPRRTERALSCRVTAGRAGGRLSLFVVPARKGAACMKRAASSSGPWACRQPGTPLRRSSSRGDERPAAPAPAAPAPTPAPAWCGPRAPGSLRRRGRVPGDEGCLGVGKSSQQLHVRAASAIFRVLKRWQVPGALRPGCQSQAQAARCSRRRTQALGREKARAQPNDAAGFDATAAARQPRRNRAAGPRTQALGAVFGVVREESAGGAATAVEDD